MNGGLHTTRSRPSIPSIGPWVPTATVHIAFLAVAVGLCALLLEAPFWLSVGLLLAFAGTFFPGLVHRSWILLVLCVSEFWREPSVTDIAFYLLLAGAHLLHVLSSLASQMPWRGRVQRRALLRPLKTFVLIQAGVQTIAVSALLAFDNDRVDVPGLSIGAAVVLGILAVILGRGLRRARTNV